MSTPVDIFPDAVAMVRLPISVERMTALCQMFLDPCYRITQQGDWIIVSSETPNLPEGGKS
jgi:hypothetical protein